jgi:hypothetical protein
MGKVNNWENQDQQMEAKFISQKGACDQFEWPINLYNEQDVTRV